MSDNRNMSQDELFKMIETHLLQDAKPSVYLEEIYGFPCFQQIPFQMLYKLKEVNQPLKYHPEGNVWNHTKMVVDEAAKVKHKSKNQKVFMWAALLHDIGKGPATKIRKGKITAYNHDKIGAEMARNFLGYFTVNKSAAEEISNLIRYHMQILYVSKNLNMAEIEAMKKETDINEIALLGLCDRLGRNHSNYEAEQENIRNFLYHVKRGTQL